MDKVKYEFKSEIDAALCISKLKITLNGRSLKNKSKNTIHKVTDYMIQPITWFSNNQENLLGYDVLLIIDNSDFFIRHSVMNINYEII